MSWVKKGLVYCPDGTDGWKDNSFLCPQPFLMDDETIRVYGSFRDREGVGRIGFVDVAASDPSHVLSVSAQPVLSLGEPGTFDDNGQILGDVLRVGDEVWMYYVAFQKVAKAKFYAFSGLAVSKDGGKSFSRASRVPVMDRTEEGIFGRCIHCVRREKGVFRVWYSVIYDWTYIAGVPYPTYDIKYIESADGVHFGPEGVSCVKCRGDEYRIGRPRVRLNGDGIYEMRYTSDTMDKKYRSGYAESADGIRWTRKDELAWLAPSASGFDDEMACYPVEIETKYGRYMFYDGNGMGKTGFGYAKLEG